MFFGFKSERIAINVFIRDASVMLVWLYEAEIATWALRETVVTVEEEFSAFDWIGTIRAVVEVFVFALILVGHVNPYKFLNGVIKVEAELLAFVSGCH